MRGEILQYIPLYSCGNDVCFFEANEKMERHKVKAAATTIGNNRQRGIQNEVRKRR